MAQWQTIPEITRDLGISYEAMRLVVKEADEQGECWVKKVGIPRRWLVDTYSEPYQRLATAYLKELVLPLEDDQPSRALVACPQEAFPLAQHWPDLCAWLCEEGLLVFSNVLDTEDDSYRWQWAGRSGAGYQSVSDAVLAALQFRLSHPAEVIETSIQVDTERRSWFSRR